MEMAEGATTRAKALSQGDKEKDNMADNTRENIKAKENASVFKTPAKIKDKPDKGDSSVKGEKDKDKEKIKPAKVKMQRNKSGKHSLTAQQGMENFLNPSKGFVAEMVDQINSTPPNSPPASVQPQSQNKKKMLSIRNGYLSVEEDDMDQCFNYHDRSQSQDSQSEHDETENTETEEEDQNIDLTSILKELNSTVRKLEKSVRRMGKENNDTSNKVSSIEIIQSQDSVKLRGIVDALDDQEDKIDMLIGIVQRQDVQIKALQSRWDAAYAKEHQDNIVINGLAETQGENCYHEVANFLKNVLKMDAQIPITKAYRLGKGQNKPMMAKLKNPADRAKIYQKVPNLKQANKGRAKPYFIADQLPESWAEKKRYIHFIKQQNKKLPISEQANIAVDKGVLSLNGKPYKQPIRAPSPRELCSISAERKKMLRHLEFIHGSEEIADGSKFVGYAAEIHSVQQAQNYYDALRLRTPDATHIACAFSLPGTAIDANQGSVDDGEHGSGRTLLSLLHRNKANNTAIFLTRHYGGKHIGAARFQIMERVAQSALDKLNKEIQEKRAPLSDEQLRQLNQEIQQQAEERQRQELQRRSHPWSADNSNTADENIAEAW